MRHRYEPGGEEGTVTCARVFLSPTVELASKVVRCGNTSGRTVDKFETLRLTPVPAAMVWAVLIEECYASLECKVIDTRIVAKYGVFILEVVKAWVDSSRKHPRTLHERRPAHIRIGNPTG